MKKKYWFGIFLLGAILAWLFQPPPLPLTITKSSTPKKILVPLPSYGFDPTEAAVPWHFLKLAGHEVTFTTPQGAPASADERMVTGKDLWILASSLMTHNEAIQIYRKLEQDANFLSPIAYNQINPREYDAIFLPGGHDKGMREYLDSKVIQDAIVHFFETNKTVAAICHGTLVVSRSINPKTGKSVLYERKTTGLTRYQELMAYYLTKYYLGDYYRTYPEKDTASETVTMEDEVRSYLKSKDNFFRGPGFPIPMNRDSSSYVNGFFFRDQNYLSARWPGDAFTFSEELLQMLAHEKAQELPKSIFDFTVQTIDGQSFDLNNLKGSVCLIVNVASYCGYTTSNYRELNILHSKYASRGLNILAFPCNQFGMQEPGSCAAIKDFALEKKAEYLFFDKVHVNPPYSHPLYTYLRENAPGTGLLGSLVKWNFYKFLCNRSGIPVKQFNSAATAAEMEEDIVALLDASAN